MKKEVMICDCCNQMIEEDSYITLMLNKDYYKSRGNCYRILWMDICLECCRKFHSIINYNILGHERLQLIKEAITVQAK